MEFYRYFFKLIWLFVFSFASCKPQEPRNEIIQQPNSGDPNQQSAQVEGPVTGRIASCNARYLKNQDSSVSLFINIWYFKEENSIEKYKEDLKTFPVGLAVHMNTSFFGIEFKPAIVGQKVKFVDAYTPTQSTTPPLSGSAIEESNKGHDAIDGTLLVHEYSIGKPAVCNGTFRFTLENVTFEGTPTKVRGNCQHNVWETVQDESVTPKIRDLCTGLESESIPQI